MESKLQCQRKSDKKEAADKILNIISEVKTIIGLFISCNNCTGTKRYFGQIKKTVVINGIVTIYINRTDVEIEKHYNTGTQPFITSHTCYNLVVANPLEEIKIIGPTHFKVHKDGKYETSYYINPEY